MRKFNVLTLFAVVFFAATFMNAQAGRTWVAGLGDDSNPSSRSSPCKTFAGAISPPGAVFEIAPAKVFHEELRLQGWASPPRPAPHCRPARGFLTHAPQ